MLAERDTACSVQAKDTKHKESERLRLFFTRRSNPRCRPSRMSSWPRSGQETNVGTRRSACIDMPPVGFADQGDDERLGAHTMPNRRAAIATMSATWKAMSPWTTPGFAPMTARSALIASWPRSAPAAARIYPPVALHRAATCIRRASRVIGSCCEHGVLLGVRNDAKGVCPACASSSGMSHSLLNLI